MNTTRDLTQFGIRERRLMIDLLQAWEDQGLPEDFEYDKVVVEFNSHSGYVFLTNSDYQVAMINNNTDRLESWYSCPICGHEGFLEDMEHGEEYLQSIGFNAGEQGVNT